MSKIMKCLCAGVLVAGTAMLTGCHGDRITANDVLHNFTPNMRTVALTKGQEDIRTTRALDTNGREFWDDVDSFLLLKKPLQLSIHPIPMD